jgi:hypothetical protein
MAGQAKTEAVIFFLRAKNNHVVEWPVRRPQKKLAGKPQKKFIKPKKNTVNVHQAS